MKWEKGGGKVEPGVGGAGSTLNTAKYMPLPFLCTGSGFLLLL